MLGCPECREWYHRRRDDWSPKECAERLGHPPGTVQASYVYDSFGNLTDSTGSLTNSLRYTAREFDAETGLHYYRARYYDPAAGHFLSEDPVRFFAGDVNFYSYVFQSPVNYTDPTGLSCTCSYSQSTGRLRCRDDETGQVVVDVVGYSGYGDGKNNPEMQDAPYVGPIPTGRYEIQPAVNGSTGPLSLPLRRRGGRAGGFPPKREPDSFLIHGDSIERPGEASRGCIVAPRHARQRINDCGGGTVNVAP
jgi:RHS repeat-associated protein